MAAVNVEQPTMPATLGERVRVARREKEMSQAELAGSELTKGFISQLENGLVRPSIRSLQVIANRLGKSLDYFLGDEPLSLQKRAEFFQLAAQAAFEQREWKELATIAEDALRLELNVKQRAQFVRWQAQSRIGQGDTEGAFAAAEEVLRTIEEEADAQTVAWVMLVQAQGYANLGQTAAAAQVLERALAIVDRHEVLDVSLRTRLLISLGTAYRRLNRTTRAVQLYESALALANRAADLHAVGRAFMGVAVTMYDSGELDGAIANYRRALELFRRIADQEFELTALHSLAAVRQQQGQVDQAEEYARQCRERAMAVGNERMAAIAEVELARVALVRGTAQEALRLARAAERVMAQVGERKQRAFALRVAAAAAHAIGDYALSDQSYVEAIEISRGIQEFPDASQAAAEYAQKLRERGEYESAFQYLEMARHHAGTPAPVTA